MRSSRQDESITKAVFHGRLRESIASLQQYGRDAAGGEWRREWRREFWKFQVIDKQRRVTDRAMTAGPVNGR